jgi:hypothetical protein
MTERRKIQDGTPLKQLLAGMPSPKRPWHAALSKHPPYEL